jgi:Flp pilus assembly protein TadG
VTAVSLMNAIARCFRDHRGASAALVALALPAMLGLGGLGVETGLWYTVKRHNQSAADAAAISAAYEIIYDQAHGITPTAANLTPAATEAAATRNGYSGATPVVTYPYTTLSGATGVAVDLQSTGGTLLAALFLPSVTIANRAAAFTKTLDNPCMILLNQTAPKELNIQGSASLSMPTCSIVADSTAPDAIYAQGANNSILTADSLITAGQVATTGQPQITLTKPAQIGAPYYPDPYATGASALTHSFLTTGMPTGCFTSSSFSGGTTILTANIRFCGGLSIGPGGGGTTVNLSPGTYWITDGNLSLNSNATLECTACVPGGAGVTIILTTGAGVAPTPATKIVGNVTQQSNAVVDNLNAPGSGTFAGLLLIQDSNNLPTGTTYTTPCSGSTSCSKFQGTPGQTLTGLVYFPNNPLTFQGNPTTGSTACLLVVANTVTLAGNSSLATSGCVSGGPGSPPTIQTVVLAD